MKSAVWLLLYLALCAEPKTGSLESGIDTISTDMGISRSTIQRWLRLLRSNGCVETENTGRLLLIKIKNWNELANAPNMAQQVFQNWDMRWVKNAPTHNPKSSEKIANLKQKMTIHKKTQRPLLSIYR